MITTVTNTLTAVEYLNTIKNEPDNLQHSIHHHFIETVTKIAPEPNKNSIFNLHMTQTAIQSRNSREDLWVHDMKYPHAIRNKSCISKEKGIKRMTHIF